VKTIENSKNTNSKYRAPTGRVIRVVNKGYGDAGASWKKKSLKGFTAESGSPSEDIDQHNSTLRQRARMLYMAAPIATSAIRTNRTNVIGCGLKLKSRINRQILGLTQEQADAWEKKVEAEFELWASRKQACDATGVNDFYALQQLTLMSWLMSGDAFVIIKRYPETPLYPYSLRLHVIEADRVSTPTNLLQPVYTEGKAENGNRIFDGVEIDENGAIVAYYISNRYPNSVINPADIKWTRVEAYGKLTGLPNILQIMDSERPEQYRGVSYLAQVIEPLLQMRRYTESELMAALVESFFTAFIKTESTPNDMPFNEVAPQDQVSRDPNEYEMGPGVINVLNPGEDVTFADPKRPSNGFDAFMRALCEQVGAALEIPADLLLKAFNASYSASRAALLEAWKAFKMRREWFTSDFCRPIYEIWMSEAVAKGRISAPGFFTDPIIRAAWLGSEWIGPSQGQLDPVKEITAEILAIGEGITTREQATIKLNGGHWDSNIEELARENQRLAEASPSNQAAIGGQMQMKTSEIIRSVVNQAIKEGDNDGKHS